MEEQLVEIDQESKVPETGSDSEDLGPEPEMETESQYLKEQRNAKAVSVVFFTLCAPLYMYFLQNSNPF